jgi:L-aspartate oxidase
VLWDHVGVERDGTGLASALREIDEVAATSAAARGELRNLVEVGRLVAAAALSRRESRGAHWRRDFPQADPTAARRIVATAAEILGSVEAPRASPAATAAP